MGLGARVVTYLHRLGLIDAVGEHSLGLRLLRIADLIKNRKQANDILHLFPTIWRLLIGKDYHTLHLNSPVKMRILPTNLASLVRLWGKLPCKVVEPAYNTIIWEVLPGRLIKSRTDAGMDLAILVEIFVQKQYGTNYKGLRVLDIGGYHGESAIFFVLMGAQRVVCVEPYPPALSRIRENLRLSGTEEHVKVIAAAVGAERGEGVLFVSEVDSQSNTLQGVGRSEAPANFSSSVKVPILTFEDILNESGWE
ncbi:MAG: FkbM family methyltransferase, partial [Bacteroidia bacterium]|nr:FkbM family methyltransferase [Bacteroidia bacterium]